MWMQIAMLGLVALLAAGPGMALAAVPPPVASLAEVGRAAVLAVLAGVCGGVPVFGAQVDVAGRSYAFYTDNVRWVLADRAEGDETDVWAGAVGPEGQLRVVEHVTHGQWTRRYPQGCSYFMQGA